MNVRMQIQTPPNGTYNSNSGIGCATSSSAWLEAYPAIGDIQSSYDGKLYFTKRHDNKFYVIPNPNDILPQNLNPDIVDLETAVSPNIIMNGRTSAMPDQIDGHNYTDERFTKLEFNTNALDCNDECLAPYDVEVYLDDNLIESFIASECPDTFEFCGDTTKIYSIYSPLVNLRYDSAIVYGQIKYPEGLDYFDFSDLTGCIENCDNLIDDDNDGLIDCDDPDLQDSCCCYIPPILELGPDIIICANGVFLLDASESFSSYRWSDLTKESTTTVYEPGKYWVEVIDSCGLTQIDSINILWEPLTQIDLGDDISICDGESVELTLNGFVTYEWYPVAGIDCSDCETITVNPDTTTSYIVVAGKEGCYSIDSINVYVSEGIYEILDTSICSNDVISIGNVELGVGDSQTFFLKNAAGCDSTLEVTVSDIGFQSYEEFMDTLICENTTIIFSGVVYDAFSKDTLRLQTSQGCDSIIYVNVGGILNPFTNDTLSICYRDFIEIFGNLEDSSGDYSSSFLSEISCDSTHTITLIVQEEMIASVVSQPTCYNEDNRSIELTISGGAAPYSYEWSTGVIDTNVIENLGVGEYLVLVTDDNNCEMLITTVIESLYELELILNVSDNICFGESDGVIDLSGNPNGLTFSLDNETFIEKAIFDNLPAGFYTIYGLDEYGCRYNAFVELYELEEIYVQLPDDTTILFGESFVIYPNTNVEGDLIYEWPTFEGLDCKDCFTPFTQPLSDIIYTLKIVDEYGSETEDEMRVIVKKEEQVFVPNIFSPNGDNINDFFFPKTGPGVKSILKIDVYDRWGGMMIENSNFDSNDPSMGWDGTCNGALVNPGVFVFIIDVEFIDGTTEVYSGDITIVR